MAMPSRDALSRRAFLAGAAALMPAALSARAPETALPPRPRPAPPPRAAEAALDPGLSGSSGLALLDVASGTMLEALRPDAPFRPASVSKIPTALYALEALGPRHRFVTRLVARGALRGGVLEGDLHLIGGGDPALDSDGLASLAEAAARAGIRRVAGRFVVDASALPAIERIDADQPVAAAYNPAVAGLNLNFNRVLVEWDGQAGERIAVEARALRHSPPVDCVRVAADPAAGPVFTHQLRGGVEYWRIAAAALRGRGGRWLPVRRPAVYAAEVFARLAGAAGIALPPAEAGPAPGAGREIARIESAPLGPMLRQMLRHSTNLTAEVVGLAASRARGLPADGLAPSAAAMGEWLRGIPGAGGMSLANHSGLSGDSRATPRALVGLLAVEERRAPGRLRALLHPVEVPGAAGGGRVLAKSGTLAFVRGLAGYLEAPGGRILAFAILAEDDAARRSYDPRAERPRGSRAWIGRARRQEGALLAAWLARHAG